jgi:tetratricopeptide (TPR) repeat protein
VEQLSRPDLTGAVPAPVGPFCIEEKLGEGRMGVVYRARHRETGQVVALKTVGTLDPLMLESARREIRALSNLRHPGVVRMLALDEEDLSPWFAMEYLGRRTLSHLRSELWGDRDGEREQTTMITSSTVEPAFHQVEQESLLGPAAAGQLTRVVRLARRLADTLAYVHGQGLVHRDLKPRNVLLRADDLPVLVDFGLTAWFGGPGRERLDNVKALGGTPAFMAPEVIRREPIDARADLYALGCILYDLVTGHLPFFASTNQEVMDMHLERAPRPPSELVEGLPPSLGQLILGLLAKRPADRPGHALDVVDALAAFDDEAAPAPPREARLFHLYRPGLAGRAQPLAEARRLLAAARAGQGAVVFVGGESGVGKTFFVTELGREASSGGLRLVTGECVPLAVGERPHTGDRDVPLHAFRGVLHALADQCLKEGPPATERLLGGRVGILGRYHPALLELPGARIEPFSPESGESVRSRTVEAMARALMALAAQTRVLLVLDDVHWADALTLDVLRYLTATPLEGCRLLVVATYRVGEVTPELAALLARPGSHGLSLAPLSLEAIRAQISDMLAVPDPPAALVRLVAGASDGNPFFVAEYLRAAVDRGLIWRHDHHWTLATQSNSTSWQGLPTTLRELVAFRLADLPAGTFAVALAAAVLGRDIDAFLLVALAEQPTDELRDAVTELLRRQVLEQPAPGRYRFVHDRLREIAYEQGSPERRGELHHRAGLLIEEKGIVSDLFPVMAHHFRAAGETDKAHRYYRLAGQQAWSAGAFHDAREHLARALELSPRQDPRGAHAADRLTEAQTRHWLGESTFRLGDVEEAIALYEQALVWLGEAPLPRSRGAWAARLCREAVRQVAHRLAPAHAYRITDDRERAITAEAADVSGRLSWAYVFRYRMVETIVATFASANLADRASALAPQAAAHAALGSFLGHMGLRRVAAGYFEHARAVAHQSGDVLAQLREAQSECIYYLNQGDWTALRPLALSLLEREGRDGVTHETEALMQALSTAEMMTGQLDAAEKRSRALVETATRLGHELQTSWGMLTLASCALRRGRPAEVNRLLSAVERSNAQQRDVVSRLECLAMMSAAALAAGDRARSMALAEDAHAIAHEQGSGGFFGYAFHWLLPEVLASEAARTDTTPDERARARARFEHGRRGAAKFARMCRIARPFALLHRARGLALQDQQAKAADVARQSADAAAALGMPFEEAQARRLLALLGRG